MNELKAFDIVVAEEYYCEGIVTYRRAVYDKSEADKVIARHKYKRCLAMARICERKRIDAANYRIPREKWEFYDKWYKRWIELADKFNEAK